MYHISSCTRKQQDAHVAKVSGCALHWTQSTISAIACTCTFFI